MAHSYILEQVDIFEDLSSSQLDLIGEICQEQSHDQDEVIFEENTPSREFFIIADGEVDIQIDPDTINRRRLRRCVGASLLARLRLWIRLCVRPRLSAVLKRAGYW
jgi:signal-transduction protein with cAMP-binding, CBS, and nucleotidyltransferase domain